MCSDEVYVCLQGTCCADCVFMCLMRIGREHKRYWWTGAEVHVIFCMLLRDTKYVTLSAARVQDCWTST